MEFSAWRHRHTPQPQTWPGGATPSTATSTATANGPRTSSPTGWLEAFREGQPITVDALCVLCLGGPTVQLMQRAFAWIAVLLVIAAPIAVLRYRRVTT
jgi:hypothetical protein